MLIPKLSLKLVRDAVCSLDKGSSLGLENCIPKGVWNTKGLPHKSAKAGVFGVAWIKD